MKHDSVSQLLGILRQYRGYLLLQSGSEVQLDHLVEQLVCLEVLLLLVKLSFDAVSELELPILVFEEEEFAFRATVV